MISYESVTLVPPTDPAFLRHRGRLVEEARAWSLGSVRGGPALSARAGAAVEPVCRSILATHFVLDEERIIRAVCRHKTFFWELDAVHRTKDSTLLWEIKVTHSQSTLSCGKRQLQRARRLLEPWKGFGRVVLRVVLVDLLGIREEYWPEVAITDTEAPEGVVRLEVAEVREAAEALEARLPIGWDSVEERVLSEGSSLVQGLSQPDCAPTLSAMEAAFIRAGLPLKADRER